MKLTEGVKSPLLEAHPGSPVDFTRPRPSITGSLASQRLYHSSDNSISRYLGSPRMPEENSQKDGVTAKASLEPRMEQEPEFRRKRSYGSHPFYIPAKVPENEEVRVAETVADSAEMDFEFEEENGIWISAQPLFHTSRTSLASTTTAISNTIDDKAGHSVLILDTSVASSAASMVSSAASVYSTAGSDVYGWEDELERKAEDSLWDEEMSRKWPSGGRTMPPRSRGGFGNHDQHANRGSTPDGKKKSLLHRVLNISGRRPSTEDIVMGESGVPVPNTPVDIQHTTIALERLLKSP